MTITKITYHSTTIDVVTTFIITGLALFFFIVMIGTFSKTARKYKSITITMSAASILYLIVIWNGYFKDDIYDYKLLYVEVQDWNEIMKDSRYELINRNGNEAIVKMNLE